MTGGVARNSCGFRGAEPAGSHLEIFALGMCGRNSKGSASSMTKSRGIGRGGKRPGAGRPRGSWTRRRAAAPAAPMESVTETPAASLSDDALNAPGAALSCPSSPPHPAASSSDPRPTSLDPVSTSPGDALKATGAALGRLVLEEVARDTTQTGAARVAAAKALVALGKGAEETEKPAAGAEIVWLDKRRA